MLWVAASRESLLKLFDTLVDGLHLPFHPVFFRLEGFQGFFLRGRRVAGIAPQPVRPAAKKRCRQPNPPPQPRLQPIPGPKAGFANPDASSLPQQPRPWPVLGPAPIGPV